jgi:hypothetical protein
MVGYIIGKAVKLLHAILPSAKRIAVLGSKLVAWDHVGTPRHDFPLSGTARRFRSFPRFRFKALPPGLIEGFGFCIPLHGLAHRVEFLCSRIMTFSGRGEVHRDATLLF